MEGNASMRCQAQSPWAGPAIARKKRKACEIDEAVELGKHVPQHKMMWCSRSHALFTAWFKETPTEKQIEARWGKTGEILQSLLHACLCRGSFMHSRPATSFSMTSKRSWTAPTKMWCKQQATLSEAHSQITSPESDLRTSEGNENSKLWMHADHKNVRAPFWISETD